MVHAAAVIPVAAVVGRSIRQEPQMRRLRGSPASILLLIQFGDIRSPHLSAEKLPLLMRAENMNQIVNVDYEEDQKKSPRDGETLL